MVASFFVRCLLSLLLSIEGREGYLRCVAFSFRLDGGWVDGFNGSIIEGVEEDKMKLRGDWNIFSLDRGSGEKGINT
jgi:hypothetical protein